MTRALFQQRLRCVIEEHSPSPAACPHAQRLTAAFAVGAVALAVSVALNLLGFFVLR